MSIAVASAQDLPSVKDGAFSEAQAANGKELYETYCSGCHGVDLISQDPDAPALTGLPFKFSWQKKTVGVKYAKVRSTMPLGAGGSLADDEYAAIVAYILNFNGYPTGESDLPTDQAILDQMVIDPLE